MLCNTSKLQPQFQESWDTIEYTEYNDFQVSNQYFINGALNISDVESGIFYHFMKKCVISGPQEHTLPIQTTFFRAGLAYFTKNMLKPTLHPCQQHGCSSRVQVLNLPSVQTFKQ